MHTPNKMMPIQKFAADRAKALAGTKNPTVIAKAGARNNEADRQTILAAQKSAKNTVDLLTRLGVTPTKPPKTVVAPTTKRSTGIGDKLKAGLKAKKASQADDIRKSANVRISVK